MSIYRSETYKQDLDCTVAYYRNLLNELCGHSIFVTGATGMICSAFIDLLLRFNETVEEKIVIYAAGRNKDKLNERFFPYAQEDFFHFVPYDATTVNTFSFSADYIIHGAGNADPKLFLSHPVDTMKDNFSGLLELLDFAKQSHTKNTLYISSSEIYGKKETLEPYKESDYGYINVLDVRSAYSMSKRAAETLAVCYSTENGIKVTGVRPGHIYGPTARRYDHRVGSSFAYLAADGQDIVMKSDGAQIRSYCYCLDCASALLVVLLKGEDRSSYNISNPNAICSIKEMAEQYAKAGKTNVRFELPTEMERATFNPMNNSSLSSDKLEALGWHGLFDAITGFSHTVKIIKEADL